jgi:hypothetical protein
MYSPRHHSSIPFCDYNLPHHHSHRTLSLSSSPPPTLPHRACYPRQANTPPQHCWPTPPQSPISPLRTSALSAPKIYHVRISSHYHNSHSKVSPPSLSRSTIRPKGANEKKRLSSITRTSGLFRLVIINKTLRKNSLLPGPVNENYAGPPPPAIPECRGLVDNFIGKSSACILEPSPTASRGDHEASLHTEDGCVQQKQLRKARSLPQMSWSVEVRNPRPGRPKHNLSINTSLCLGGDNKDLNTNPPRLEPAPLIRPQTQTQPCPRPRRPSAPLRLFPASPMSPTPPTSPTSLVPSSRGGYIDTSSPVDSAIHPLSYLQQQVSVFEDDEEKPGLAEYFKLNIPKRSRRSQQKSEMGWKRVLCWSCAEE